MPVSGLPTHDIPEGVDIDGWSLRVDGAVSAPIEIDRGDLREYPMTHYAGDFECEAGWTAENLSWRGIPANELVESAGPSADASHAVVRSLHEGYACVFPLERLRGSVIALELDGEPLPVEHGGPARLVPVGQDADCWESVKWVTDINVTEEDPVTEDSAKDIALSRIDASE